MGRGYDLCMHAHHNKRVGLGSACALRSLLNLALLSFWHHEETIEGDFSLVPAGSTWKGALFRGKHPLWIPPATSDPCGMVDTSTSQMMLNPICLANFLLWSLLFCLFLFCFVDFIMKMIFCGCSSSVGWLTVLRHIYKVINR